MSFHNWFNGLMLHGSCLREYILKTSSKKLTIRRCPNTTQSYQTFTQSLFLDEHLLHLSGSAAGAGGGLAISTCPPPMSRTERCARWLDWLQQVSTSTDYHTLVKLCHDFVVSRGGDKAVEMDEMDLELVDIEKKQIEDLTNMRKSPHLLPYRRYIYIGEVSLQKEKKERFGAGVSPFLICHDPS
jgi:hypothetical protein